MLRRLRLSALCEHMECESVIRPAALTFSIVAIQHFV
nr:MAG TPA: hypothetical protein [Caudoviricetes sp.]